MLREKGMKFLAKARTKIEQVRKAWQCKACHETVLPLPPQKGAVDAAPSAGQGGAREIAYPVGHGIAALADTFRTPAVPAAAARLSQLLLPRLPQLLLPRLPHLLLSRLPQLLLSKSAEPPAQVERWQRHFFFHRNC